MPKKSRAIAGLPMIAKALINRIGRDLRISRLRRGISLQLLAERMFVSRQTLERIEKGDPTVSIGIYLSCVFCLNRLNEIKDVLSIRQATPPSSTGLAVVKSYGNAHGGQKPLSVSGGGSVLSRELLD